MDKNLQEIINFSWESGSSILSMLLEGKKVQITSKEVETVDFAKIKNEYPGEFLSLQISYSGDIAGKGLILLKKEDAGIIYQLIMGGDISGTLQDVSVAEISAISETFSHIMDSWTSPLEKFNIRVKTNIEKAEMLTFEMIESSNYLGSQSSLVKCNFIVEEILSTEMLQIFSKDLSDKLSSLVKKTGVTPEKKEAPQEEVKVRPVKFSPLEQKTLPKELGNIELILDVPLQLTVELGRAKMSVKEVLELSTGQIVELDRLDGEPIDILANGRLIAKGEVVVIGEVFGVRVTDILTPEERLGKIRE